MQRRQTLSLSFSRSLDTRTAEKGFGSVGLYPRFSFTLVDSCPRALLVVFAPCITLYLALASSRSSMMRAPESDLGPSDHGVSLGACQAFLAKSSDKFRSETSSSMSPWSSRHGLWQVVDAPLWSTRKVANRVRAGLPFSSSRFYSGWNFLRVTLASAA